MVGAFAAVIPNGRIWRAAIHVLWEILHFILAANLFQQSVFNITVRLTGVSCLSRPCSCACFYAFLYQCTLINSTSYRLSRNEILHITSNNSLGVNDNYINFMIFLSYPPIHLIHNFIGDMIAQRNISKKVNYLFPVSSYNKYSVGYIINVTRDIIDLAIYSYGYENYSVETC